MDSLHLKHREKNNVKWELTSEKAILPVEKKEIHLQSLSLKINQSPAIYLTSGSGIYEIERGDVTLHNAVELKVKDSMFLTDTIKWHSRDEAIRTDDDVKFTGGNFLITGSGLAAKVKQQKVRILKDVKATFYR
jgi:LPS export ABC transporter protein LptC